MLKGREYVLSCGLFAFAIGCFETGTWIYGYKLAVVYVLYASIFMGGTTGAKKRKLNENNG
jgi:hypothetical protein